MQVSVCFRVQECVHLYECVRLCLHMHVYVRFRHEKCIMMYKRALVHGCVDRQSQHSKSEC